MRHIPSLQKYLEVLTLSFHIPLYKLPYTCASSLLTGVLPMIFFQYTQFGETLKKCRWPNNAETSELMSRPLPTLHPGNVTYLNILHQSKALQDYVDWPLLSVLGRLFLHIFIGLQHLLFSLSLSSGALMMSFKLHRAQKGQPTKMHWQHSICFVHS